MINTLRICLLAVCTAFLSFATVTIDGGPVTLTTSAVALSSTSFKVNKIVVKVVPGQSCKAYVGKTGHSRISLSGVFAVLYPNSTGGFSEEWSLQDPRATDGIDLSTIAVSGDCAGEQVTMMYFVTGNVTSILLRNYDSGPHGNPAVGKWQLSSQSQTASVLQVRVIPGQSGKINLYGGTQSLITVLYPNTGNVNQNSAHSEPFDMLDYFGGEHIRPYQMYMSPDIQGELVLSSAWTVN